MPPENKQCSHYQENDHPGDNPRATGDPTIGFRLLRKEV